jgi:hypothetical protein
MGAPHGRLMAVPVHPAGCGLAFGTPARLFRLSEPIGPHADMYDVAPDGRILAIAGSGDNTDVLKVPLHWKGAK